MNNSQMKILFYLLFVGPFLEPALGNPSVLERASITIEAAKELIAKAEAKALSLHRTVCIAVVDDGGNLLAFERMDGAFLAGIELSQGKARSALRFEEPTAKIEAAVHDGRYALVTAGAVEMQGGIPLLRGSEIIGAIGVSGADTTSDVPIAESAVADFAP
jgi:glc operon protein GlcG